MRLKYLLFIPLLIVLVNHNAFAQLSGPKTIPGDYATIAAAIAALNSAGVGSGGVTFNVANGHTETLSSTTAGTITATGTETSPIIFQKSGAGNNPKITAFQWTSATAYDGMIKIAGGDYITFDGIDLQENPLNTTLYTDWGYAIVKASATDGSQNITIKNCTASLNKANTNSVGIYGGNHTATSTTSLNISALSGTNVNIKINNCNVSNCYNPISFAGYTGSSTYYDSGLEIGTTQGNTVSNYGGASSATYGIFVNGQNAPKIENNSVTSGTATGSFNAYGINIGTSCDGNLIINANTLSDITCDSGILYGIYAASEGNRSIYSNQIFNLTDAGTVYGLYWATNAISPSGEIYKNNIYNLSSTSSSGPVRGIYVDGGTTINVYNNFVSDLKMPAGNAAEPITAIYVNAGTPVRLFYNTIFLNATSSGINFGSNGVYYFTGVSLDMRNNIIINVSKPKGSGKTVAFRMSNTSRTNYQTSSNNNCFYAGPPRTNKLICYAGGTNSYQTIQDFKTFARGTPSTGREQASFTEDVPFVNKSTTPYDLHVNTSLATLIESGGIPVSSPIVITDDYDGNLRNATTPDGGADEFTGIRSTDQVPPVITYTPLGGGGTTSPRNFPGVSITDGSGVNTTSGKAPRVYFKKTTDANTFNDNTSATNGWKWVQATGTGPFDFLIDYTLLDDGSVSTSDTIQYFVVAQDLYSRPNVAINSGTFEEQPSDVNLVAYNFPILGTINSYSIFGPLSGNILVGTGQSYTSLTADSDEGLFKKLNTSIIAGDITVRITSDLTETGAIALNQTTEEANYSITIQPDDASLKTISGNYSGGLIRLNGADKVTIDGRFNGGGNDRYLSFSNNAGSGVTAAFQIISLGTNAGATDITIRNCNISTGFNSLTSYGINSGGSSLGTAGNDNDNLTIVDNVISKAFYGINVVANSTGATNNITITSNTIGSETSGEYIGKYGINVSQADDVTISGNTIFNIISDYAFPVQNHYGISLSTGVTNAVISGNNIHSLAYTGTSGFGATGIAISTGVTNNNILVINNLIYDISGDGLSYDSPGISRNPHGIFSTNNQSGIKIYNNSIYLYGNTLNNQYAVSTGITLGIGTPPNPSFAEIINNIIVNNLGVKVGGNGYGSVGIFLESGVSQLEASSNNLIFVNADGSGDNFIGQTNFTGFPTLQLWRENTGKDTYSFSGDPAFTSNTNLLPDNTNPNCWAVNNKGMPLSDVATDFNGNPRSTTVAGGPVDIGAYEFSTGTTPPAADPSGPPTNNGTTTYNVFEFEAGSITWGASGTVPSGITFSYYTGVEPIGADNNSSKCYWDITSTGGTGFSYDVTFNYDEAQIGVITSEDDIRLAKSNDNGVNWTPFLNSGTGANQYVLNTTDNTIKVHGLTSFSLFALTDKDAPLPVELNSFTAAPSGKDINLKWETETEVNSYGFEVERSEINPKSAIRNPQFTKIGFVAGHGNSNSPKQYSFTDNNLNSGKYIYRLKMVDNDGSYEYSPEVESEIDAPKEYLLLQNYPNPFNPTTRIDYQLPFESRVTLELYNITGERVDVLLNQEQAAGYYTVEVSSTQFHLSSGVYIYRMTAVSTKDLKSYTQFKKMVILK